MKNLDDLNRDLILVADLFDTAAPLGSPQESLKLTTARTALASARTELAQHKDYGPTFKIANAALALSQSKLSGLGPAAEKQLLQLAVQLYDSINRGGRFSGTRDAAAARLAELGDTVPTPPTGDDTPIQSHQASPEVVDDLSSSGHSPLPGARPSTVVVKWDAALARWKESSNGHLLVETFDEFSAFARSLFSRVTEAASHLDPYLREDITTLRVELDGIRRPDNPSDVLDRATEARRLCFDDVATTDEQTVRRRWLVAACWNFSLWRGSGWATNRPQVVIDLLGYVQSFQLYRRYRDDSRELLIAATELAVLLATDELPPLVYERFDFLNRWVCHSAGTFLLLSGPDPIAASLSRYDARIGPHDRRRWAEVLLELWRKETNKRLSACLSLLSLSGWNGARLRRLLELVFEDSSIPPIDGLEFWTAAATTVLESTRWVRVAANPWNPGGPSSSSSLSTDEAGSRIDIPNSVLKAIAAEITERGAPSTIQGALFKGRRVPTYLCVNDFGPFGILKVDLDDRIRREKVNFDAYAKRLHPRFRASECIEGNSVISDNRTAARYKAILTSYVFTVDDVPRTLAEWLRGADVNDVGPLIDQLFLTVLRPWLSHTSRAVTDLRYEYPVLRPSLAEQSVYAPDKTAETELRRLVAGGVTDRLGFPLRWDSRLLDETVSGSPRVLTLAKTALPDQACLNPLWMAAQLAELSPLAQDVADLLFMAPALTTSNVLHCICHGDLHGENVLVFGDQPRPSISVIDFEATHAGHICKDFARLEAAILCRLFSWNDDEASAVAAWFGTAISGEVFIDREPLSGTANLQRAGSAIKQLRKILAGCGQGHWPITNLEYQVALLASLLPFVRYPDTAELNRLIALALASAAATSLCR